MIENNVERLTQIVEVLEDVEAAWQANAFDSVDSDLAKLYAKGDLNFLVEEVGRLQQPTATTDYDYDLVINENGHIPLLIKVHGIEHMVYINEVDAFKLHKKFRTHRLKKRDA